jgi:hypothetical protein
MGGSYVLAVELFVPPPLPPGWGAARVRTYVARLGGRSVGYVSLGAGSVGSSRTRDAIFATKRRPLVPVVMLPCVSGGGCGDHGGLRRMLILDRLRRGVEAAEVIGAKAVVAHASGPEERAFLEELGFQPLPGHGFHMYLQVAGIVTALGSMRFLYNYGAQ